MRVLLFAMTIFAISSAQAGIYKCVINGETTFSQQPCSADAEKIQLKSYQPREQAAQPTTEEAPQQPDASAPVAPQPDTAQSQQGSVAETTSDEVAEPTANEEPEPTEDEQPPSETRWRNGPVHGSSRNR